MILSKVKWNSLFMIIYSGAWRREKSGGVQNLFFLYDDLFLTKKQIFAGKKRKFSKRGGGAHPVNATPLNYLL
jgi:hypothetical protein